MSKFWITTGVILSLILSWEIFYSFQPQKTQVYITNNTFAAKVDNFLIFKGPKDNLPISQGKLFRLKFTNPKKVLLSEMEPEESFRLTSKNSIHRLSESVWKIKLENTDWLFFASNYESFPTDSRVSSQSNFWLIEKSTKLPEVSVPKEGIITLSDHPPSKKYETMAKSNELSFIPNHKYQETFLRWHENQWEIKTFPKN